jgi:hypothetical protein
MIVYQEVKYDSKMLEIEGYRKCETNTVFEEQRQHK